MARVSSGTLEALLRLAEAVGSATTLDEIYDAALDGIRRSLGIDRASILLFDPDGVMRFKAWRGLSDAYRAAVEGHTPWRPGDEAPAPVLVPDVRHEPSLARYADVFERDAIASLAFFPLLSRRRVIGTFMLYRGEPYAFSPDEVNLALTIGHHIGFAVERTRSELDSRTNHQRLLFALDAAQMGTWEWDLRTNEVRWSENLERIHGLPPGAFNGRFESYQREIHPEDRERVFASVQGALTADALHDVEYRIVAPDGTVRWVHGKGRLERGADGAPAVMSGVCMDVSARKRAELEIEAALRQEAAVRDRLTVLTTGSQELLTTLEAESVTARVLSLARQVVAADAYAVWRRRGDAWRVEASEGLSRDFSSAALAGDTRFRFDEPLIAEDVTTMPMLHIRRAAYAAEGVRSLVSIPLAVRGEPAGSIVFYYRTPHRPSDMELRVAVALGQLAAAAVTNAELHAEQQHLRAEAQQSAERAAFLAEASVMLSSLDYEANLRRVAEIAVPRLADWCAVDLLDQQGSIRRIAIAHVDPAKVRLAEQYHARYPPRLGRARGVAHVIQTGRPELYEEVPDDLLVDAAQDEEHLRLLRALEIESAMVVPLTTGARAFGAMTFVSSTPGRRYGQADVEFATELARRAAYAVENARLYREAQEANRLKDEFLATLSHELRTPLNVIMGRARMLRTTADPATARAAAEAIERNGATLTRLVEDLLDLSRISQGRLRLESAPVQVADVVDAAVQVIQPAAAAKGVVLQVDADSRVPAVTGDATRLQQVIWNLLVNAVKFTPADGRVTVKVTADPDEVVLEVSDTGCGIDAAFLPHVFEMFRQAQPASERRQGGLGLGLSIVRRLVELHGGAVAAHSDGPGRGATFTVRLPRSRAVTSGEAAARDGERQAAV